MPLGQNCLVSDDVRWTKTEDRREKGATAAASHLPVVLSKAALAARLCVSERKPSAHLLNSGSLWTVEQAGCHTGGRVGNLTVSRFWFKV